MGIELALLLTAGLTVGLLLIVSGYNARTWMPVIQRRDHGMARIAFGICALAVVAVVLAVWFLGTIMAVP